jgi:hypothetical protein
MITFSLMFDWLLLLPLDMEFVEEFCCEASISFTLLM